MLKIEQHYFNTTCIFIFEDLEDSAITALRKRALNDYAKKCIRYYTRNCKYDFMHIDEIERDRYVLFTYYPSRPAYTKYFYITNTNRWISWIKSFDYVMPAKTDLLEFLQGGDS